MLGWQALLPSISDAVLNQTQIAQLENLRRNNAIFHEDLATCIRSSPVFIQMMVECSLNNIRTSYPTAGKSERFDKLCQELRKCIVKLESEIPISDPHNITGEINNILVGENGDRDHQQEIIYISRILSYTT